MIYSIIIIISLLSLIPIQCFYIINGAVIEQCSTGANIYLNKFESNKMRCIDKTWRQVTMNLEYHCINNVLTHTWTIKANTNQSSQWPQTVFIFTDKDYKRLNQAVNQQNLIIEEVSNTFNPNNNQLTTYLWTTLTNGPKCRMKYTIIKDVCTTNKGKKLGGKLIEFICYYGIQNFDLSITAQRDAFNKLVNDNIKPITNGTQINSNSSALGAGGSTSFEKSKKYIFIGGGAGAGIILVAIVAIVFMSRRRSTEEQFVTRMSVNSNITQ